MMSLVNADSRFTLSAEGQVDIQWNGKTMLVADTFEAMEQNEFQDYDGYLKQQVGEWEVHNLWRVQDVNKEASFRREVAQNGDEAELTIQYRIPAYYFEGRPEHLDGFYRVRIPMESIRGMKFSARLTVSGGTEVVHGVIGESSAQQISGKRVVYLTLEDEEGNTLSYDFGPSGIASFNSYVAASSLPQSWWARVEDNELRFAIGRLKATTYPYNGIHLGKIRISEDRFEDWERRHPHQRYRYFMELYASRQFSFGAGNLNSLWTKNNNKEITELEWLQRSKDLWLAAGKEPFSQWSGYGWDNPGQIQLKGDLSKGVLHGWAAGRGKEVFRVAVSEPGVYVFTVRVGHLDAATGPFSLSANDEVAVQDLEVKQGEIREVTFSRYLEEQAELEFSGNWAVSTIAVQPLLTQKQDFVFQRGLWLAGDIPTPTTLYQFERRPVPAEAAVQGYPVSNQGPRHPTERDGFILDAADPETMWRWESAVNALGPGNNGSFYEFETEEMINRRLDELEQMGISTILLNGFLIRHAYPEEHERIQSTIKLITSLAHARGMKLLDHFDLTIVPNMSAAYQQFVENIEWAQKDVRNGQVTRGYCINNPHFLRYFTDKMVSYVRETNIDGLMLDEICFHAPFYCGCEHCRDKFYQDTGLTLPVDETSPDLLNSGSRLWNQWLLWRIHAQADFPVAVLKEIREVRPDFVWMRYGAPIVFSSNLPARWGSRLDESVRYSSFMGIETISTNIHGTHRFNLVSGSILNSLVAPYNIPTFVLIYAKHQPVFAYAGWIMGNMNGQLLWMASGNEAIEEDSKRYLNWEENMDIRQVSPVADVGVFYSQSSRDFSQNTKRYEEESIGLMQQLDDLHVPYQVLLERDVTLETLSRYPVMILPGVSAISDDHLRVLQEYIRQGGKVLMTGYSATEDEYGIPRQNWPLTDWLQVSLRGEFAGTYQIEGELVPGDRTSLDGSALKVVQAGGTGSRGVLASLKKGNESFLAIVSRNLGQGSLVWAVPGLGAANFEADGRTSRNWHFRENRQSLQVLERLLTSALGDRRAFRAVEIPEAVKIRVYRDRPQTGDTRYVHLYNATGGVIRKEGVSMTESPLAVPFPRLKSDLVFEMELDEGDYQAKLVSPDFEKHWTLQIEPVEQRRVRITVPAQALYAYAIVRIEKTDKD